MDNIRDLLKAANALVQLAERKKLDATTEGYDVVQTLKDEIALYERSKAQAELAISN